jgi:hypothetical protein
MVLLYIKLEGFGEFPSAVHDFWFGDAPEKEGLCRGYPWTLAGLVEKPARPPAFNGLAALIDYGLFGPEAFGFQMSPGVHNKGIELAYGMFLR